MKVKREEDNEEIREREVEILIDYIVGIVIDEKN